MRWYIIRTLLHKELLRHLANKGGLVMMLLLVCAAMLLAFFGKRQGLPANPQLVGGVHVCYVDYYRWEHSPLVEHLRSSLPPELERRVRFRSPNQVRYTSDGAEAYEGGTGVIQIRGEASNGGYRIRVGHRGNPAELAPYEKWFFEELRRYTSNQAAAVLGQDKLPASVFTGTMPAGKDQLWMAEESQRYFRDQVAARLKESGQAETTLIIPSIEASRWVISGLSREPGLQDVLASALILFALFFANVYLLPSLTCEERERGILLAQALTPASPLEILAAKFIFYPGLGLLLGAGLACIYRPSVLFTLERMPFVGIHLPFFWLALAASSAAFLGIGLTISSLARTQRAASLGAMCYLLSVSLLILICQINLIPFLTNLSVENHTTLMMRSVLAGVVAPWNWGGLLYTIVLAGIWCGLASYLFRRHGWQ